MNKKIYIKLISGFWLTSLIMLLVGCADDTFNIDDNSRGEKVAVKLSLNVPGISQNMTRAMDTSDENAIDMANLQVLVFEKTADGREVFRYNANITERNGYTVTLLQPKSLDGEQYRFVVLANADAQTIAEGTTKEDALNQFVFSCAGKWNASDATPSLIPMWGEFGSTIVITREKYMEITVHRALARVDVGLLFKYNNNSPQGDPAVSDLAKEEVWGLDNFKLKEIRVYRTKNQAYVASSADKISNSEVVIPNIPSTANYNSNAGGTGHTTLTEADKDPLLYVLPVASDKFVREIYVPESLLIDGQSNMDNVPCLVIGGYYGATNTSKVTYYRADFATYAGGKVISYNPILRNHRYVFDIKKVSGEGFEEPEEALKSISANLELTVEEWNEVSMDVYVQGHYFFSIDNRYPVLDAKNPFLEDELPNHVILKFDTNIDLIPDPLYQPAFLDDMGYKNIDWYWKSSGTKVRESDNKESPEYTVYVIKDEKFIVIQSTRDNVGGAGSPAQEIKDDIVVTVENMQFTIHFTQKASNISYNLLCDETKVHGKYRENIPLNYTHYLEVVVVPDRSVSTIADFEKAEIEIKSETRKGIKFEFKGTIEEGLLNGTVEHNTATTYPSYKVKLQGTGTPVKDPNDKLNPDDPSGILTTIEELRITTNSISGDFCENTRIIFGYQTKNVLTIGANAIYRYGYMLEPNTASRAFMDASINFGVDPNSAVTMEQNAENNAFTIEYMTAGRGMSGERIDEVYLKRMLNDFKPAIILTGQAINYSSEAIKLLTDFVKEGGVMLMFNEYYPNASSIQAMVNSIMALDGATATGESFGISMSNLVYSLPSGASYAEDPILNGPFGDVRGKQFGSDGTILYSISVSTSTKTISYSNRDNQFAEGKNMLMFRHKTRPFFFIGDGGFISNAQRYIGPAYPGSDYYCPFAIDSAYRPIARTNFTSSNNQSVYNSQIFGNIVAWAVDYAENSGITYPSTGNKFP